MATYYISPTGNDTTGNGSEGNPWRSLKKVLRDANLAHGDIAHAAAGDYTPAARIDTVISGTAITPLTVIADAACTMSLPVGVSGAAIAPATNDWVHFSGSWTFNDTPNNTAVFIFEASQAGSKISTGSGVRIVDVTAVGSLNNGGIIEIKDSFIHDVSWRVFSSSAGGGTAILDGTIVTKIQRLIEQANPLNLYIKNHSLICGATAAAFTYQNPASTYLCHITDSCMVVGGTGYNARLFSFTDAAGAYFRDNADKWLFDGNRVYSLSSARDSDFFNLLFYTSSTGIAPLPTKNNWFASPGVVEADIATGTVNPSSLSFGRPAQALTPRTIGLCGDSIMAGFSATAGNKDYEVLRGYADRTVVDPIYAAISGLQARGLFWALDYWRDGGGAELYCVGVGVNNANRTTGAITYGRDADDIAEDIIRAIDKHKDFNGKVCWIGCLSNQNGSNAGVDALNTAMAALCDSDGIVRRDVLAAFKRNASWATAYYANLSTDVHPNNAGHAIIADVADSASVEVLHGIKYGLRATCDSSLPTLALSPDCPGKLRGVQEWRKVASAREIERY